jgi:hypothetical protein
MLVPYSEKTQMHRELIEAIGGEKNGWYFGLTPRHGIERLLPNHVLDLSTWQPTRHWPAAEDLAVTRDTASAVSEIASILERLIGAAARAGRTYIGLTAGRHTRMLLACARPYLDRVTFFTMQIPDAQGSLDLKTACRIATRFVLDHVSLPWQEPTQRDLDEWFYRTGGSVGGMSARAIRTLRQLDPTRSILTGMAGGIGEVEGWSKSDLKARQASCRADLLDFFGLPPAPALVDRAERWIRGLPTRNLIDVLGLRYPEQRLAWWGSPQEYGYAGDAFVLTPFCHRRVVQLKLTLPIRYRWRDRLPDDLLKHRWPELLDVPFDKVFGLRGAPLLPNRILSRVLRRAPLRRDER